MDSIPKWRGTSSQEAEETTEKHRVRYWRYGGKDWMLANKCLDNKCRNMLSTTLSNKRILHIWLRVNHQSLPELKERSGPQEEFTKLLTKVPWNLVPTPRISVVNVGCSWNAAVRSRTTDTKYNFYLRGNIFLWAKFKCCWPVGMVLSCTE